MSSYGQTQTGSTFMSGPRSIQPEKAIENVG
jgi:hypothetical protein